jgi:predicted amidohydrolase YtcJ
MAQALAIGDGRVLAVGSDQEIERRIGLRTRIVQLGGRTVIAGINDAHDHVGDTPFGIEAVTATPPMADPALAEVVSAVQAAASNVPKGTWVRAVVGPSVMQSAPEALSALEAAVREHPVLLSAWWGHGILVTPAGLSKLQIGEDVSDRPGGEYERDTTGRLTGKLQEYAAWSILQRLHSEAGEAATVDMLRAYGSKRLAQGVTSVQIMAGYQKPDLFLSALRAASLPVRLRVVAFPLPDAQGNGTDSWANIAANSRDLVTVSGVKWVLDGTPIEQLAYQSAAYPGRPDWYGRPNFSDDHLRAQLQAALDGGEQLLLHVVGDAMAERVLTLMEDMAPPDRWVPLRVRIEHGNGLTGARIERAKRLGIVIAQPRPTSPVREWIDAGIPVAYGSDMGFPPFVAFAQMTDPANPNSISRENGLAILTQWPAFAEFAEETKGKLAPGMVADMVVLSQDPLTTVQARLPATVSLLTIVNGDVVHAGDEFAPLLSSP